ncbi:MAG: methyltransferase [Candidatus Rokuibacteriota bacterium]|nr:MAG: methyltransferase [Candidatus Rokubacteria bacterium]PYN72866.1 MAG: methyltransferase [Candidatus Rokubacteria bacterium]
MSEFDRAKAKAFTQLMVRHLEGASVAIMIEVGRRVGLFEAMAKMSAVTSDAIAAKTGLSERYVREWLGAMVCGGIVEYAAGEKTYRLPPEHAAMLTGPSIRNLTSMAEMLPLMSRVIPDVAEAFRSGRGVPYSAYQPDFTGLMDRRSRPRYDELLFSAYLAKPEGLIPRLEAGMRVADVGCGTGYGIALMARRFPKSTFVGHDISEEAIGEARAAAQGLTNASFVVQDVVRLETPTPYDLVTAFDAIHDQADPAGVLRRIRDVLAPGGTFLMVDVCASSELADNVGIPMAPYLYTMSTMHCMSVSLAGGGPGLGTAWGHQLATRMLREAGFADVQLFERVEPANSLYVARATG